MVSGQRQEVCKVLMEQTETMEEMEQMQRMFPLRPLLQDQQVHKVNVERKA
jgi:hypothetical protein